MAPSLLLAVLGLAMLVFGSDRVVDAASALAHRLGLSTLFIGVTFVAVGSSVPEITSAVYAGVYGAGDFLVGHVIGSVVSQITLGVGLVGLFYPLSMDGDDLRRYGGGMLVALLALLTVVRSGRVSVPEGAVLVAAYLGFLWLRYHGADDADDADVDTEMGLGTALALGGFGMALVAGGGHLLVSHSRDLAVAFGVPHYLVGFLTGLGTTAPEIVISVLAVRRDEAEMAVGTLFGSNITDPLFSLGVGTLAGGGIRIEHVDAAVAAAGYMLAVSVLVVALFVRRDELSRPAAAGCALLYLPSLFI